MSNLSEWLSRVSSRLGPYRDIHAVSAISALNTYRDFLWERRALLRVSSLNNENGYIYWDGHTLFDPNEGREGVLSYKHLNSVVIHRCILLMN